MSEKTNRTNKYFVEVVAKALDVLDAFRKPEDELTLSEIARRTNLPSSHVFRLLYTLEQKGWVRKVNGSKKFHRVNRTQRWRVGFAMQSGQFQFSQEVLLGLEEAAEKHGVQLIVLDNEYREDVALSNAQTFVHQGVDFVIEFQVNERIAPVIAHTFVEARIPCLAIDIPQPGAVYFGANNYQAGLLAGRALGEYARSQWKGNVDKILLLEQPIAGVVPQARMTGAVNGIQEVIGAVPGNSVVHLDAGASEPESRQVTGEFLRSLPPGEKVLIATIHDPAALGAVRAIKDTGRSKKNSVIIGHNATQEAREEICKPNSSLLGLVGFFPEKYGEQIIPLVLKILGGEPAPPMAFIEHALITKENVAEYYPPKL
ncbi:MAG: substrate-binding domain-containing protein [Blastocatellia bacterium]|nr:substrate-binding domain-containing protein [Blastocatellia bacterium]